MKKTVLITGTSSGFGKTTARLFLREGWNVVATMRHPEAEQELTQLPDVLVSRLDVQDRTSIAPAIEASIARFGTIDALVNNAGFGLFGVFESTPREKVFEQFEVNVFGLMDVTRAILPHFRARRSGVIVNVGSGAGVFGLPMISLYCASKFAIEGFSESLAYELAPLNIRVKMIEPGGVVSTNFGQRSGAEATHNAPAPDYNAFVARMQTVFAGLRKNRTATEEDVARVIFQATTDNTDRLRYVATKDIEPLVQARRETNEDHYLRFMREQLGYRLA